MEIRECIKEANNHISEINKSQKIVIVDENGNETDLSLKYLIQFEENIIYGWCQARQE